MWRTINDCHLVSPTNTKTLILLTTASSYTWANELCAGDNEERAIVISSMNGFQYAVAAWLPIVIFPQTMAPTFRYGFPGTFGLVIAALVAIVAIQILHIRSTKNKNQDHTLPDTDVDEESSITGEHPGSLKCLATESKIHPVDRSAQVLQVQETRQNISSISERRKSVSRFALPSSCAL